VITATDNKNGIKDCLNKYLLSVFIRFLKFNSTCVKT
jgi:hypothetical protein